MEEAPGVGIRGTHASKINEAWGANFRGSAESKAGQPPLMANAVAVDSSFGFQAGPDILRCCGANQPTLDPPVFYLLIGANAGGAIWGIDQCTGQAVNLTPDFTSWWSDNSNVATVTTQQVHSVAAGSAGAWASGWVTEGNASYCTVVHEQPSAPVYVNVPSSEITESEGTYQITEGQFLMTLDPSTPNYDGHTDKESSPVIRYQHLLVEWVGYGSVPHCPGQYVDCGHRERRA